MADRTCTPGCRNCAASDRLYALARVVEESGDWEAADVLMRLAADGAGAKTPLGNRMAAAVLGDATGDGEAAARG